MKKKPKEMTFKEFFEEARKDRLEDATNVADWMLNILREEGFSREQINEMKMEKAWRLVIDSSRATTGRDLDSFGVYLEYVLPALVEKNPEVGPIYNRALKDVTKMMKELTKSLEKLNKELEEKLKDKQKRRKHKS